MSNLQFEQRLKEIKVLIESNDLSRATRRLMDFFVDFPAFSSLKTSAMDLRADYNRLKELGEQELSGDKKQAILERLHQLIAAVDEMAVGYASDGPAFRDASAPTGIPVSNIVYSGNGLSKTFNNGGHYFKLGPIDFNLKLGELTGVVGENGNGKTTLLKIVAGLLNCDEGNFAYPYFQPDSNSWYDIKHHVAYIPQRLNRWYGTLEENLKFAASTHGIRGRDNSEQVEFVIHRLGLTNFRNLTWGQLSSGYKLRFELAKMLVWRPTLLVLDEPLANLDLNAQQLFLQDLSYIAKSQQFPLGVILSSQQLHEIEHVSDNIIFLRNGHPLYNGMTQNFATERKENSFEVAGSFDRELLMKTLQNIEGIRIEDSGTALIIHTPVTLSNDQLLQLLLTKKLSITYFRDISTSTKKLFNQEL